jgi:hypothetical protein
MWDYFFSYFILILILLDFKKLINKDQNNVYILFNMYIYELHEKNYFLYLPYDKIIKINLYNKKK